MSNIGMIMNIDEKVKETLKKLGMHIKKLREEQEISTTELAQKTGIRKEYLEKIEDGRAYGVRMEKHLLKISKGLGIKFYQLFDFE